MKVIRKATAFDLPSITKLAKRLIDESEHYKGANISRLKIALVIGACIKNGVVYVIDVDGEIVGGIAGHIGEAWYSTDKVLSDVVTYIVPEHRGGYTAMKMIRMFVDFGIERGAKVEIGVSSGINPERTGMFYQRLGGKPVAQLFKF